MTKCRFHIKFILWALLCVLMLPVRAWCVPAGTVISNTAQAAYTWGMSGMVSSSNTVNTTIVVVRTKSKVEFLQYAPSTAGAQPVIVPVTEYSTSGADIGPFVAMSAPVSVGSSTPIDILNPVPLVPMTLFHEGQPVFVRLTDPDQNRDVLVVESVLVRLENAALGESELLRLKETGANTGVFVGYIQSKGSLPAKKSDGVFTVLAESVAVVRYTDSSDAGDSSTASVMVDPYGIVFDSSTGLSVDGARISLIDASTGLAARVYGDDGISIFPATVISGGTATDAGGKSYRFPSGRYRFPFVVPGTYRLQVGPLPGYSVPSTVSTASLQKLPGGPYVIAEPGSRGEVFTANSGPPLRIDIPVDPVTASLWITKTAGKDTVAIGDFLPYTVSVRNTSARTVNAVSVTDRLPLGSATGPALLKSTGKSCRSRRCPGMAGP